MKRIITTALILFAVLTILLGIAYPLATWIIGTAFFRNRAEGSFIMHDGKPVGSALIGQPFSRPEYFHPRPSAVGYDASVSGGSNLAPSNPALTDQVKRRIAELEPENPASIPTDMVTSSASGLDPHISAAAALWQAWRVCRSRGIDEPAMVAIINRFTERPCLGFIGEARVNVLLLNFYLDEHSGRGEKNE